MEPKPTCLIVDDEPLAREVLKSHLGKIDSLQIAGVAEDAIQAFDFLNRNKVDLLLLDIHMPEMKGTDLIKNLKNPPAVILTTAHREYALEGYDLNVVDFLLKPISFPRFLQAIEKFFVQYNDYEEVSLHTRGSNEEFLYMREKNIIHKIALTDIVYAESMGDNLTIHTQDRSITSRITIAAIEKLLPTANFMRIHRSFIVSIKHITSFSPVSIYIGKKEFPIGPSFRNDVLKELDYQGFLSK